MKPDTDPVLYLSDPDTQQFGVVFGRAVVQSPTHVAAVDAYARENQVALMVTRCPTGQPHVAQDLEHAGHFLADTLLYYSCALSPATLPEDQGDATIRYVKPDDVDAVGAVAASAFHGYFSHYHVDRRLPQEKCDAVFKDWTRRSCTDRSVANEVLIAELDGQVKGFATLRLNSPEEGEGVLFAVDPSAQRRGIYRSFMVNAMRWSLEQGCSRMVVSTQVTNIAVQKSWTRLGFELSHSYYTFHKWYD